MSGPVVGIDLGTTNTVVGVVQDGQAKAIADGNGDRLIPSVVSFHPGGNVLVGKQAKERRLMDAPNTIYSVKRLIGRSWESEEVKKARARFPFEMREGPGQAALVVARGETYTLPEISAFVLRKAKAIAEEALGEPVERAVITVPANFNDLQRAATKVAGRVAGLEVLRILNEPTAAALAYGYGKGSTERIAIYDFGGGTFDVTLLDLSGNVFEVLATAGNTFLGGDDVDLLLAERMADAFLAKHRLDPRDNPQGFERLRAAAEQLKIDLSGQPRAAVSVEEVAHGPGGKALNLDFQMTRREFEELAAPLIQQTFDTCREALGIARLEPKDFDQVLLVGGSTRIPLVKQQVESFFGRQAMEHISPDEVVAIGAAIQASALTGAERRRAELPRPPLPAARKSQALAQTMQIPSSSRKSEPPPLPKRRTSPGVRPSAQTSPGVYQGTESPPGKPKTLPPGRRRDQTQPPMVIQPPEGMPQEPVPHTADGPGATRRRQTTGMGLGGPPPPPRTVGGLGARGRVPTGSGLGPAADQARRVPTGSGLGPAAEQARRVPTGSGLGPPDAPRRRMPTGDYGTPGVANRPRIPTGQGLGPSADAARQRIPTGRGLGGDVPGTTMLSATEEAKSAQRAAEKGDRISVVDSAWQDNPPPLPLVGVSDHEHDDLTVPATEAISAEEAHKLAQQALASSPKASSDPETAPAPVRPSAPDTAPVPQGEAELRAKYGNLPLIMPGASPAKPIDKPTLESSQMPDLGALADAALEDALELPREPDAPKPGLGGTLMLSPEAAEQARPPFESAESRTAMELRQYAAPTSTDEVTLVRQAPTPPSIAGFEFEDELPIPDVPGSSDETRVGKDPLGETVRREVPPGLGQTQALESPRRAPPPLNRTAQLDQPINLAETTRAAQSPFHTQEPAAVPPARPPLATTMGIGPAAEPVIRDMPPPPHPSALGSPAPRAAAPSSPLLVDVTPLSLTVETVSGYCDRIIQRNTPVPCEETRQFVTARDNQTAVRLRVSQGESSRFEDNTLLGELELLGLRPAPRGQVSIAVTFALDTNGMLNVSARDTQTGQATSAVIRLVGLPEQDIQALQARQHAHPM